MLRNNAGDGEHPADVSRYATPRTGAWRRAAAAASEDASRNGERLPQVITGPRASCLPDSGDHAQMVFGDGDNEQSANACSAPSP